MKIKVIHWNMSYAPINISCCWFFEARLPDILPAHSGFWIRSS